MRIGILGRGFGIYGYLPACHELGWEVHTLRVYKKSITARGELIKFERDIQYEDNDLEVISNVDALVIARDPSSQAKFILKNIGKLQRVYLEKPLGVTSPQNAEIVQLLSMNKIDFSIGYLFPYLSWYQDILVQFLDINSNIVIDWGVLRPRAEWKSNSTSGGGLVNFYFVHFAPLIFDLDLDLSGVNFSSERVQFRFVGGNRCSIEINLFFSNAASFSVMKSVDWKIFEADSPFSELPRQGSLDPRVPYIKEYLIDKTLGSIGGRSLSLESVSSRIRSLAE